MYIENAFSQHLTKAAELLATAAASSDPARELYRSGARTTFFMLEALGRLAMEIYDEETFGKMRDRFKAIEDGIGAIDHYDAAANGLADQRTVPREAVVYLRAKANESVAALESVLQTEGWLDGSRLAKLRKRINKTKFKSEKRELAAIADVYQAAIDGIIADFGGAGREFTDIEHEIHEMRRDLRWLSIYPQALGGAIQMSGETETDPALADYLTPDVISSPFNRFPAAPPEAEFKLVLGRADFLALSWMIAEFGRLKDEGLTLEVLRTAIQMTETLSLAEATQRAEACFGARSAWEILKTAEKIAADYFATGSLKRLVREVEPIG